ncbi:alpha/beta hydrolase [Streptomyces sp. NBC_00631]|uniref:alpha/beta hydrolase fold domain-containing protein n=1 Tax=Streptomyces sp. NBC_00631 TaxID=2975793 RepID=UPI0030DFF84E
MWDYDDVPLWNIRAGEVGWDHYLGEGRRGSTDVSPYAAPARAQDLSGLPPAFVTACQYDAFRAGDVDYAQRLAHADVPTELALYPGVLRPRCTRRLTRTAGSFELDDLQPRRRHGKVSRGCVSTGPARNRRPFR